MSLNLIFDNGTHKEESAGVLYVDTRTYYNTENLTVSVGGVAASNALTGDYVADVGADVGGQPREQRVAAGDDAPGFGHFLRQSLECGHGGSLVGEDQRPQ